MATSKPAVPAAAPKALPVQPNPAPPSVAVSPGRKKATYEKDLDAQSCKVTLPSGHSFAFTLKAVAQSLVGRLAFHGLIQKVMDAAAGERGPDAITSMKAAYDQLVRGVWTERIKVDPAVRKAKIADAIVKVFGKAFQDKHGKSMTRENALAYPTKTFNKLARDPRVQEILGRALVNAESVL